MSSSILGLRLVVMNQNATEKKERPTQSSNPSPAAPQLKSIPEVTLVNIELALLPTVKFHHNSNNIDNNDNNNNNNINGKLLILNNSFWR